jgi:SAM-dependent methyltransferase
MASLAQHNPTGRFTGLADKYARFRPDYPAKALDTIVQVGQLGLGSLVVDVGCGTGISSRLLARRGIPVLGIEPNDEMRAKAQAETPADLPARFQSGKAEATGLVDCCADLVLAAQAFHWFEAEAALVEFRRILKPGGWVVLMWNERDNSDPFTARYTEVIHAFPPARELETDRARAGEVLLTHPLFVEARLLQFSHCQTMDEEGMLGRAFSASYAPRDVETALQMAAALRRVFADYQKEGSVILRYETSLYFAQCPTIQAG